MDENVQRIMQMIAFGGDARMFASQAITFAREKDFKKADELLKQSDDSLIKSHEAHTSLLTDESQGKDIELSLFMVHGTEHLANADVFNQVAHEFVTLYKKGGVDNV